MFYIFLLLLCFYILLKTLGIEKDQTKLSKSMFFKDEYHSFISYLLKQDFAADIPRYKFFSSIITELLVSRKTQGIDIRRPIAELRKAAVKDRREGKKVKAELYGLLVQYIFIACFTWFFLFQLKESLNLSISITQYLAIGGWQLIGVISAIMVFYKYHKSLFYELNNYFYSIYIFRSLLLASRPINDVINQSKVKQLRAKGNLRFYRDRVFLLVSEIRQKGNVQLEEFDLLIEELWDIFEENLTKLKKTTAGIKLILILFFVFPSFLFSIYLSTKAMAI